MIFKSGEIVCGVATLAASRGMAACRLEHHVMQLDLPVTRSLYVDVTVSEVRVYPLGCLFSLTVAVRRLDLVDEVWDEWTPVVQHGFVSPRRVHPGPISVEPGLVLIVTLSDEASLSFSSLYRQRRSIVGCSIHSLGPLSVSRPWWVCLPSMKCDGC